ncbi:MAG: hypothetical protein DRR08_07580 [Candidatus Parabeggiatoa sp. nov. 2]|nr:MAG: hypothetical protein B6247_03535 [Beggiatoa sp. 4572_84]RKZ61897.1 MAG: hypothetical protein DRR08_07580 [Gammaproteobacteria bacterium]
MIMMGFASRNILRSPWAAKLTFGRLFGLLSWRLFMKKYLWFAFVVLVYSNPIVYAREDAVSVVGYSGIWGDWGKWQYCPKGSFAAGYAMKVEAHRDGRFDDSAVNGIKLCQ